jgi:hypothetical protein
MAAPLGFKTFATGDVLTAADTNGYLMQGVWTFADAAARDAAVTSPQEGNMCYLKDTDALQFYSGTAWTAVGGGGGGGKVLQVVSANYSTSTSNSTSTFADTGLTATITPTLASSKVLVIVSQNGCTKSAGNSQNRIALRLMRGATSILSVGDYFGYTGSAVEVIGESISCNYLDSPATTSATTYKTQFMNPQNAASVTVQFVNTHNSTITLLEIGA